MAIIGAGNMGKHHARIYSELPNVTLVAICDADIKRAESMAKQYDCRAYTDYNLMCSEQDIEAVSITAPTYLHHKIALDILDKNIHILLEKPIATTVADAREIIKKAEEKKAVLLVGHIERFNPAVVRIAHLVESGRMGDIISLNIKRVGGLPPQAKNVDVVMDLAIHDIDVANYLIKESPTEVLGYKSKNITSEQADSALILLKYPKSFAFVEVNWVTPVKIRTLDVTGTKAFARLDYVNQTIILYENSYPNGTGQYENFNEYIAKFYSADAISIGINKAEPLKCELEEFISAIQENRKPRFSPSDACNALEIALKI